MNLRTLRQIAQDQSSKQIEIILPSKEALPCHLHITEVGLVTKEFTDCGGTFRGTRHVSLQTWVADDVDHRMTTDKLAMILGKLDGNVLLDCLEVLVEVQADTISTYAIHSVEYSSLAMTPVKVFLRSLTTDCLAKDRCGVGQCGPETPEEDGGCCGGGCC
jgi:hypothetical protein